MFHVMAIVLGNAPCPTLVIRESQQSSDLASSGLRCRRGVIKAAAEGRQSRLNGFSDNLPAYTLRQMFKLPPLTSFVLGYNPLHIHYDSVQEQR
jgi:hypothetical protein